MHKSNALKDKGTANGMGASESGTGNMVSYVHVKRSSGNYIYPDDAYPCQWQRGQAAMWTMIAHEIFEWGALIVACQLAAFRGLIHG